jgi:hypothetical protein
MAREITPEKPQSKAAPVAKASPASPSRMMTVSLPRIRPPDAVMRVLTPRPGIDVMAGIDRMLAEIASTLPHDPYLRQMLVRYANMLSEGEGADAGDELGHIDTHVASIAHDALRRQKVRGMAIEARVILSSAPNAPPRTFQRARVFLQFTGKGHRARRYTEINLT